MTDDIVKRAERKDGAVSTKTRVAALESLAAQLSATLTEMRREAQESHIEMRAELRELRAELSAVQAELRAEVRDLRRLHEQDFRITFGAVITATIGLAALIARATHRT